MSRYPHCFNTICDRLMARGVGLRRQTRSDVWWIMGTIDLRGDVIPRQFRNISPTMKSRFQEIANHPLSRELIQELERLVYLGIEGLRRERRRQYRNYMERVRGY